MFTWVSQFAVDRIHHQQVILLVAGAERICAVAYVLRAAIPEIAEVEHCVHRTGCIAAGYLASIDSLVGSISLGKEETGSDSEVVDSTLMTMRCRR